MESLSREKVLHAADLGRIAVNEEEIEKFGVGLKQILDQIDKIINLDIQEEDILISPSNNFNVYRNDESSDMLTIKEALSNAPKTNGNYVEVVRVVND